MKWSDFVYFFIGVIIPTYNLVNWIGGNFAKPLKRLYVAIKIASKS